MSKPDRPTVTLPDPKRYPTRTELDETDRVPAGDDHDGPRPRAGSGRVNVEYEKHE